jgi:hypothetical protein
MPFRLRSDACEWFKDIKQGLGSAPMFDMYYFCLLPGLATTTLVNVPDAETSELIDSFPGDYAAHGRLITALFLSRELKRQGVELNERTAVNTCIRRLVDPNSASRLSADGLKTLNQYAHGGYEVLSSPEWFNERPRTLQNFLPLWHRHLKKAMA